MNGIHFFVSILALGFLIAIPWAMYLDRRDWSEAHLLHGPGDNCPECLDK